MIEISSIEEYNYCVGRGYKPLLSNKFKLPIGLRIEIQRSFFGNSLLSRGNIVQGNDKFYRWMWDNKKHYCEECLKPLNNYSSVWVSHILARGAFPEMALDPRNVNILCDRHHTQWETGNKKEMRIYPGNKKTIDTLISEYASKQD